MNLPYSIILELISRTCVLVMIYSGSWMKWCFSDILLKNEHNIWYVYGLKKKASLWKIDGLLAYLKQHKLTHVR